MWIRTQNKKELINVIKVGTASIFGDKRNKAVVWGWFASNSLFVDNKVSLGMYPTMKEAITEINEIEKCILDNPNGVYTMKSNE